MVVDRPPPMRLQRLGRTLRQPIRPTYKQRDRGDAGKPCANRLRSPENASVDEIIRRSACASACAENVYDR